MEIADAADVDIYGYKDENKQTALVVRDSERVHLYGYGGISWSDDGEALFEVERSDDFRLAGLFLRANPSNDGNPGTWSMVRETLPSGELFETTPLDLPTLYKRGGPIDVTPPVVGEKTSVPVATANPTPSYTFSSSEAGTITYGGSCSSSTLTARASDNQVTLDRLAPGLYEDCTVRVADRSLNDSAELAITPFAIVAPSATLTGDCPGAIALTIDGGAPNGTFALLGGTAVGDDLVPSGTCAGRITRLDGARVVAIGTLNEQGGAQLERSISTALCGNYLQVVDIVTCEMSPLVVLPETEKR